MGFLAGKQQYGTRSSQVWRSPLGLPPACRRLRRRRCSRPAATPACEGELRLVAIAKMSEYGGLQLRRQREEDAERRGRCSAFAARHVRVGKLRASA